MIALPFLVPTSLRKIALIGTAFLLLHCSDGTSAENDLDSLATGGNVSGTGGDASSGGFTSTGGESASGGQSASGGAPGTGGLGSGGAGSGGAGSGGNNTGGIDSGSGGQGAQATPSAGCGSSKTSLTIANARVGLPDGYDGNTPYPVVFAFHAAGNGNDQLEGRYQSTALGDNYVMIYLAAQNSSGWTTNNDKSRFDAAYSQVLSTACVDENRVYATGHSSGSQFIVQLLCGGETRFDAIAPIASSVYCANWVATPTLNIHGTKDEERMKYGLNDGDGKKDLQPYLASNGCEMTSAASSISTEGCGGNITPGCVDFAGCDVPTTWCNHNDPQYGTTNHGIPCFAASAIYDFFESLP
jgi:polyhydroxybutyrate depolymerase